MMLAILTFRSTSNDFAEEGAKARSIVSGAKDHQEVEKFGGKEVLWLLGH